MKKYSIILSVIIIIFASCQKNATDVKLPPAKIQLVVQSFISPQDSLIKVYVSQSTPIFGQSQQNNGGSITLPDAKVEITYHSIIYNLLYNSSEDAYIIDSNHLKIIAGETYNIKVSRGGETVTASCTVPFALPFDLSLDKIQLQAEIDPITKDTMNTFYRMATSFTDLAPPSDYYRLHISGTTKSVQYFYNSQGNIIDSSFSDHQNYAYFENNDQEFVSDVDNSNTKILQNSSLYLNDKQQSGKLVSTNITFGIMHTDVNYYKYHISANAHLNNQGNPFAEPSLVFTNIQGGLGIFAAYNYRYWIKKL